MDAGQGYSHWIVRAGCWLRSRTGKRWGLLKVNLIQEVVMAELTEISWCDATFNPWMGCTKVSPACANCYAERDFDRRYKKVSWGPSGTRVLTSDANWAKPLKWNQQYSDEMTAFAAGLREFEPQRPRVFCASLADVFEDWRGPILNSKSEVLFHPESDASGNDQPITMDDVRRRLFALIDATPQLNWLLLTKRPENIQRMWWGDLVTGFRPKFRDNVWLGTSVENQEWADRRIPALIECRRLSPVLFLSCEPMVGPVDLGCVAWPLSKSRPIDDISDGFDASRFDGGIGWVIAGGESGPNARACDPDWFRSLRDQCASAAVPFHFKQWGEFDQLQVPIGKKAAGRLLDGVTHDGFPNQK